ncbi:metallophosphoesterase [Brucella gallinifaecis]|uniref:Serine/threonine protein phosphatase n=1 Tax=Brucella gallinifaecis TaxID=215590 RepID=A0A502BKJ2_9HYPH|nr:metallophosphoesterase [Brucella gallinifaecis]TPF74625.1 serine/threonine protein phosphatase [Brucella gallinifaecis]
MSDVTLNEAKGPEDIRLYAIGDIHGRLDLLQDMHGLIRADIDHHPTHDWRIIHLGDYIDRGPDSNGVLEFLIQASTNDPRIISLIGNHDDGLLRYLATGDTNGIFALHGGSDTARSYGVDVDYADPASAKAAYSKLLHAIPQTHVDYIRSMPSSISFGDFFFCHAGVNPTIPLDAQDRDELMWIRTSFLKWADPLQKVIIHGHTPQTIVDVHPNRVNLDTYAWKNGKLSAIVINGQEKRFLEVTGPAAMPAV